METNNVKQIASAQKILNRARNDEHADFHRKVTRAATEEIAEAQHFGPQRTNYVGKYGVEDEVFKTNTGYASTEDIQAKDQVRDEIFIFLKNAIDNASRYPVAEKREAAKVLSYAIRPYRSANVKTYTGNTAEIYDLIQTLRKEENAQALTTLGLDEVVTELEKANQDFEAVFDVRSDEKRSRKVQTNMKTIRPEVDAAFGEMVTVINVLYYANELVAKDEEIRATLGALIDKINSYIVELDEVVSRRTGGSTTELPDEGGDEPTPEPVTPEITAVYQKEGGDPENPNRIERGEQTGVNYKGFTLKGQDGTLEHVIGLVNDQDYIEWINPETITNVTETSCEFTMVPDLTEGQYKVRIETYDGGSPLVVEYPEPITLW